MAIPKVLLNVLSKASKKMEQLEEVGKARMAAKEAEMLSKAAPAVSREADDAEILSSLKKFNKSQAGADEIDSEVLGKMRGIKGAKRADDVKSGFDIPEDFTTKKKIESAKVESGLADDMDIDDDGNINLSQKSGITPSREEMASMEVDRINKLEAMKSLSEDDVLAHIGAPSTKSSSFEKAKRFFSRADWKQRVMQETLDENQAIKYARNIDPDEEVIKNSVNKSESYMNTLMAPGKVTARLNEFKKLIMDAESGLKNANEVRAKNMVYSLRAMGETAKIGKQFGNITPEVAARYENVIRQHFGDEAFSRIHDSVEKTAKATNDFRLSEMSADPDVKLISPKVAENLKQKYKYYMPHVYDNDTLMAMQGGDGAVINKYFRSGMTGTNLGFLKPLKGGKYIIDWNATDRLMEGTARMLATKERIRINKSLAKEFGVTAQFSKNAEGKIVPTNIPSDYVFIPKFNANDKNVYAFPRDVAKVIMGMDKKQADIVTETMAKFNSKWKALVTTYRLPFALMQIFSDASDAFLHEKFVEAGVNAKSMFFMPKVLAESILSSISKQFGIETKLYKEAKESGLFFGSRMPETTVDRPMRLLDTKGKVKRGMSKVIFAPFHLVGHMSEASEQMWRLAQFKRAKTAGLSNKVSAMLGREITVDFEKMGHATRIINKWVPFFNPAVQGGVGNLLEDFIVQPKTTLFKASALMSGMASVYIYNKLRDEEDFKKVDPYLKDGYALINSGIKNGDRPYYYAFFPIPRDMATSNTWKIIRRGIDAAFEKGVNREKLLKKYGEDIMSFNPVTSAVSSVVPPVAKVPLEVLSNYDYFRGRPINPASKENLSPEYRSRPSTSNIYRMASQVATKAPGMSSATPAILEHITRSFAPPVKQLEPVLDSILEHAIGKKYIADPLNEKESGWADQLAKAVPFLKPTNYDSGVEELYNEIKKEKTSRADKLYLAKQAFIRSKEVSDDDEADAQFRLYYRGLDREQRQAFKQFVRKYRKESRMTRREVVRSRIPKVLKKFVGR